MKIGCTQTAHELAKLVNITLLLNIFSVSVILGKDAGGYFIGPS
jgi:hypothetical protein